MGRLNVKEVGYWKEKNVFVQANISQWTGVTFEEPKRITNVSSKRSITSENRDSTLSSVKTRDGLSAENYYSKARAMFFGRR